MNKIFDEQTECRFGSDKKICSSTDAISQMKNFIQLNDTDEKIVNTIKDKFGCQSESCVYKQDEFIRFIGRSAAKEYLREFFKPEGPATSIGLLSNYNIDDVLDQLEEVFTDRKFQHIPFQMRDFDTIGTELATINLADEYTSGSRCFGVVLNTDYHTGGGLHWFCLFIDFSLPICTIEYFNSSGNSPIPEVIAWIQKTKHYLIKSGHQVNVVYASRALQRDHHSCGVWCLCYIWARLKKMPPSWFTPENVNDEMMVKLRKNLFRHEN